MSRSLLFPNLIPQCEDYHVVKKHSFTKGGFLEYDVSMKILNHRNFTTLSLEKMISDKGWDLYYYELYFNDFDRYFYLNFRIRTNVSDVDLSELLSECSLV